MSAQWGIAVELSSAFRSGHRNCGRKERQPDYAWRKAFSSTPEVRPTEIFGSYEEARLAMAALWPSLWLCQFFDVSISVRNSYTFSRRVDLPYTFLVAGNHFRDATKMVAGVTNAESFSLLTHTLRDSRNCKNTYEILNSRIPNGADYNFACKFCWQSFLGVVLCWHRKRA